MFLRMSLYRLPENQMYHGTIIRIRLTCNKIPCFMPESDCKRRIIKNTKRFYSYVYSHKKRKDSLETRAERAVLRAYVENQAILESILLYRVSKYKQTKNPGC